MSRLPTADPRIAEAMRRTRPDGLGSDFAAIPQLAASEPDTSVWPMLCVVTGATAKGEADDWRWEYDVAEAEVTITDGAYPVYSAKTGGWTGKAYNTCEDANTATGDTPTGIGITRNQMGTNFTIASLPDGWTVIVNPKISKIETTIPADPEDPESVETTETANATRYYFYRINPMPGSCS